MSDLTTMKYNVDMVFCIDATGSMSPVIDTVKQNALHFYDDVIKVMNEKQKSIDPSAAGPCRGLPGLSGGW